MFSFQIEADLSEDKNYYHMNLYSKIPMMSAFCTKALLYIQVIPSTKTNPKWLSSPTKPGIEMLTEPEEERKQVLSKRGNLVTNYF